MRIYGDCHELVSETRRDVYEMGVIVKPKSMQNKDIEGDEDYITKEIINYHYCLTSITKSELLFLDPKIKTWADAEFDERVHPNLINPGEAWKLREDVWTEFLVDGKFDYTYNERMGGLPEIIKELKRNPDTRQAILSIWDRTDVFNIGGKKRVPCSVYYHFLLRDGKLNIIYNQRSCDVVVHFGNDIYLAWKLKDYVANRVGVEPGYLYHNIASLHAYKKDWETLKTSINELTTNR